MSNDQDVTPRATIGDWTRLCEACAKDRGCESKNKAAVGVCVHCGSSPAYMSRPLPEASK